MLHFPLDGQRPREIGSRPQVLQPETSSGFGFSKDAEQAGGLSRSQRDVECVERLRKPVAGHLDEGLLTRPAPEERRLPLVGPEAPQLSPFPRREVVQRDVLRSRQRALLLDVDTHFAAAREGQEREPA